MHGWAARAFGQGGDTARGPLGGRALLLALAIAATGTVVPGRSADATIVMLAAAGGYATAAIALTLADRRLRRRGARAPWLAGASADVALVTLAVVLTSRTEAMPALLYLAAIVIAVPAGTVAVRATTALSVLALIATLPFADATARATAWEAAAIAAVGGVLSLVLARDAVAAVRLETWRAAGRAGARIAADLDGTATARAVAHAARALTGTSTACVWWWDPDAGTVRPAACEGDPALPTSTSFSAAVLESLAANPDRSLLTVGRGADVLHVSALTHDGRPFALLVLGPAPAVAFTGDLRARVASFVPWAAEALARTRDHAAVRDALAREVELRELTARLAGASTHQSALEALSAAVHDALDARVAILNRASGAAIAGDHAWADARDDRTTVVRRLDTGVMLIADREAVALTAEDRAWLDGVARVANPALRRCAARDQLVEQLALVTDAFERLPAPALLHSEDGRVFRTNAAFRALRAAVPPLDPTAATAECTLGDPPRRFVVESSELPGGRRLRLLREVTRERLALQAKEDLIAMMGHELRTPLTSVQGYSRIMMRHLDVVRGQVERLDRMIESFVDASRIDRGMVSTGHVPLDPAELVHEATMRFRGAHEDRDLRVSVGPALPVLGDRAWLSQVLDNLLENAEKYSPPGCPIELLVRGREQGTDIGVRDLGQGIASEDLDRIFERSYRVPGDRAVQGQGLGLSIVRDLVAAHGGSAWAESAGLGHGSTFWFRLPIASDEDAAVSDPESAAGEQGLSA